jgi:hypothetical protein
MRSSTRIDADLAAISLFRDLSPPELERVTDLWHLETFPAGTNVMWMEQPG